MLHRLQILFKKKSDGHAITKMPHTRRQHGVGSIYIYLGRRVSADFGVFTPIIAPCYTIMR